MTGSGASLRERLIPLLADGEFHSGEDLAQRLGVSRTAVWKALNGLEQLGVELHRVPKRGYRLTTGGTHCLELLDAKAIAQGLSAAARSHVRRLDVHLQVDSTNSRLLEVQDLPTGSCDVCLAEHQTAGRGRRGRTWIAPFGAGLCLSVSWLFPETPRQLSAMTLAAGVAMVNALNKLRVRGIQLKWPNDVLFEHRKLGGILAELRAESGGPVYVVVGVGLNLQLSVAARQKIRSSLPENGIEAAALGDAAGGGAIGRNVLAAAVIDNLIAMFVEFQRSGLRPFAAQWSAADALSGKPARVQTAEQVHQGIARGIDEDGALLLETPGALLRFTSGEVSLRSS